MVDTTWNDMEVASKPVVMAAARQFAETLSETAQFTAFEEALYAYRQDAEAQNAVQAFQKKQSSLRAMLILNAMSEEDRQELQHLQERFYQQQAVQRYTKAQEELVAICQEIGDLISIAIGLDYGISCRTGGCCG